MIIAPVRLAAARYPACAARRRQGLSSLNSALYDHKRV